jgi:hypothetical protein
MILNVRMCNVHLLGTQNNKQYMFMLIFCFFFVLFQVSKSLPKQTRVYTVTRTDAYETTALMMMYDVLPPCQSQSTAHGTIGTYHNNNSRLGVVWQYYIIQRHVNPVCTRTPRVQFSSERVVADRGECIWCYRDIIMYTYIKCTINYDGAAENVFVNVFHDPFIFFLLFSLSISLYDY